MNNMKWFVFGVLVLFCGLVGTARANGTAYYLDVNGTTPGFGDPANTTYAYSSSYWSTDSTGVAAPGTLPDGAQVTFGYPGTAGISNTTFSFTGRYNVNGIIFNVPCTATLSSIQWFNGGTLQTWLIPSGAILNIDPNNLNYNNLNAIWNGSGTINANGTSLGWNTDGQYFLTQDMTNGTVNLKAGYTAKEKQASYKLLNGTLNFATVSSTNALGSTNTISVGARVVQLSGGVLDNTSGSALTLNIGAASYVMSGSFAFAGSSSLNLNTNTVNMTGTPTITVSNNTFTIGGAITNGGFGKAGAGTLALSGTGSSYAGSVSVSAGTLRTAAANTLSPAASLAVNGGQADLAGYSQLVGGLTDTGSSAGIVTNSTGSATLTVSNSAPNSFAGTLAGSGLSLTKVNTGTLTLSGTNTYGGNTTISVGALSINDKTALPGWNTAGRYSVAAGAALTFGNSVGDADISTMLGTGNFDVNASIGFDTTLGNRASSSAYADNGGNAVGLFKVGANTLTLSGANTYSGGTTINGGNLQFSTGAIPGAGLITINSGGALNVAGAYTTVAGWLGSGKIATGSAGALALTGDSSEAIDLSAGSYASLMLGASANATYSGTLTPNNNTYRLGGGGATLTVESILTNGASAWSLIAGTTGSSGAVLLTKTNVYSGWTTINGGTLQIGGAGLLGSGGTYAGAITNNGVLQYASSATQTLSGVIAGTGSLVMDSDSVLRLTSAANNTYSGDTVIKRGTLVHKTGGISLPNSVTYLGDTSGSANATLKIGEALNGSFTLTKGITVQSGNSGTMTLNLDGVVTLTVTSITLGSPNSTGKGLSIIDYPGNATWGSSVIGVIQDPVGLSLGTAGRVLVASPGAMAFSSANTYSGGTTVTNGVLATGNASALGSGLVAITNAQLKLATTALTISSNLTGNSAASINLNTYTLTVNQGGNSTFAGAITNSGTLVKDGIGTLTLSGTNTYAGSTWIKGGALEIGGAGQLGGGTYNNPITNAASLLWSSTAPQTLGGAISGGGSLTKTGTGTLTLAGTNTYTGVTTISNGTLAVGATGFITNTPTINLAASTAKLDVTAASGAAVVSGQILMGIGSVTGVTTVAAGGLLIPGGTNGTMSILGSSGTANLVLRGTLAPVMDASRLTTTPWLSVTGSVDLATATLVATNLDLVAENRRYTLLTYTGSRAGTFGTQTLTSRWNVYYDDANKRVQLLGPMPGLIIQVQ